MLEGRHEYRSRLNGVRVLVVDDAQYVLDVVTEILKRSGAEVTAVSVAGARRRNPAAALTAYTAPEHRASVIRAGFQGHVAKPVGARKLVGVVAVLASKEQPSGRLVD